MFRVPIAAVVVPFLLWMGAHAANDCDELTGVISGSMVFEHCTIPRGSLTIGSGSDIKFFNLTATGATISVQPLNVIIHVLGGLLTAMAANIFVVTGGTVRNVTLHAKDVYARGTSGSAFSILGSSVQGVNITLEDCDIDVGTSSGDRRGIGGILPSSLTFTIEDVTLTALRSTLKVRGRWAVTAMGVAVWHSSPGRATITSLLAHVIDSDVQAVGTSPVSSVGISVHGERTAAVMATDVTLVAHGSSVATSGSDSPVATLGIAVYGGDDVTVTPTNVMMAAHGSNVTTSGSSHVSSISISVEGMSGAAVSATKVMMVAHGSNVRTNGNHFLASLGIVSWCWANGCHSTLAAHSTLISGQLSHITAAGPNAAVVVVGFGSFGLPTDSFVTATMSSTTLIACSSTIGSSEVTFDVVAWRNRPWNPPIRFEEQLPVSVANLNITVLDSTITTEYAGWTGNCLMSLPNATHNSTAPSVIRDSVLNCTGLPRAQMAPEMLFVSNVTDRDGAVFAPPGAVHAAPADLPLPPELAGGCSLPADDPPTATPEPLSPFPIVALVSVLVLSGDFAALVGPNFESTLSTALQTDLANALGVESRLITIITMRLGSLIVDYTVTSTTSDVTDLTTRIVALPLLDINTVIPRVTALFEAEHGTRDGLQIISSSVETSMPHSESPASSNESGGGMPTWGLVLLLFAVGVVFSAVAVAAHRVWTSRTSKMPQQEDHPKNELTQAFVEMNECPIGASKDINSDMI